MSINPWIELLHDQAGVFQLAGTPNSNHNKLLYGKALLACHEDRTIYFIDSGNIIDKSLLEKDLQFNSESLSRFFVFTPNNQLEFFKIVDDLELLYLRQHHRPTIFISSVFQFVLKDPSHSKNIELLYSSLGLLKTFSSQFNISIFVSNETRKQKSVVDPFLDYILPRFFDKVLLLTIRNGEQIFEDYNLEIKK